MSKKIIAVFVLICIGIMAIPIIASYLYPDIFGNQERYSKQLILFFENGTCNVIESDTSYLRSDGRFAGPILFSSSNVTEAMQWALNQTQGNKP